MLNIYKKSLLLMMVSFFYIGMAAGFAFGYSITIDAIDDAGQFPGQNAYLRFSGHDNIFPTLRWTTAQRVYGYASDPANNISVPWTLESAGNIWSSDLIVGDSLKDLDAGTYRITPIIDDEYLFKSFQRDKITDFGWSDWKGLWWWEMKIQASSVYVDGIYKDSFEYTLGSSTPYESADDAWQASMKRYIDINLAEGGSLSFWIYDNNTIDNAGGLSVNITSIPEPSMILLLSISLMALPGMRKLRA